MADHGGMYDLWGRFLGYEVYGRSSYHWHPITDGDVTEEPKLDDLDLDSRKKRSGRLNAETRHCPLVALEVGQSLDCSDPPFHVNSYLICQTYGLNSLENDRWRPLQSIYGHLVRARSFRESPILCDVLGFLSIIAIAQILNLFFCPSTRQRSVTEDREQEHIFSCVFRYRDNTQKGPRIVEPQVLGRVQFQVAWTCRPITSCKWPCT